MGVERGALYRAYVFDNLVRNVQSFDSWGRCEGICRLCVYICDTKCEEYVLRGAGRVFTAELSGFGTGTSCSFSLVV